MPIPISSEPGYGRPVIIVQSNAFNESKIKTVIYVVITSNTKLASAPGNIFLSMKDSRLPKSPVINIFQLITLDKIFLTECIGSVRADIMIEVEEGIKLALNLV